MPAIHAGMTNSPFSFSVDERKLMNHSVVDTSPLGNTARHSRNQIGKQGLTTENAEFAKFGIFLDQELFLCVRSLC
jgi:hypothetical protein